MRSFFTAFWICAIALGQPLGAAPATATENDPRAGADELLASDRTFGRAGADVTSVNALLAMFDDDVVLFAVPVPGFARGRDNALNTLARALGDGASRTTWAPIRVGISADGRHGFTFGYMTTVDQVGESRSAKYVSYWIRRPQGWRVVLFKRVPRSSGVISHAMMDPSLPIRITNARPNARQAEDARDSLARREREFSDAAQIGIGPAFAAFGSPDAVNTGGSSDILVGAEAIGGAQGSAPSSVRWEADGGVIVAPSGDLGVTWGYLRRNGPTPPGRLAEIPFFTIWRRANETSPWLYIAE